MQTEFHSCRSCGYGFSAGRGFAADHFCSIRCQDWFDAGNAMHGEARKGHGPFRVVASGNPDEIGKPLALRPSEIISADELVNALSINRNAVTLWGIVGSKGAIRYRTTNRRWQVDVSASKAKRIKCVANDGHGRVHFHRLPTSDEAETIRSLVGLKMVNSDTLPEKSLHSPKKAVKCLLSH